jgi:predicted metalloprotease with PDZ domain
MKNIQKISLLFILIIFSFISRAQNLDYNFDVNNNSIKISLTLKGDQTGETKFLLPLIITQSANKDEQLEKNLKIFINGNLHKIKSIKGDYIILKHQPYEMLTFEYLLNKNTESEIFYLFGKSFFMNLGFTLTLPELLKHQVNKVTFSFNGTNGTIFSNVGAFNKNVIKINATINEISRSFLSHGAQIKLQKIPIQGYGAINLLSIAENKLLSLPTLAKDVKNIYQAHYKFFEEKIPKNEYLILLNNINFTDDQNKLTFGYREGFSDNNFSVVASNTAFDEEFAHVIAHEHLHNWIGKKIAYEDNENRYNMAFFIEGFTDYYSFYLNYLYGSWSEDKYIENYNKCLKDYFSNPFHAITNEVIKDNFFIDSANKIVYLRGRIIANELNVELQKHTKYDLDFYIKTLIKNIDNNNEIEVNMESLIQTIRNITGYDAKKFLSIKTNSIDLKTLAPKMLNDQFILHYKTMQIPEYGFNIFESLLHYKISGLNKNSKAYKNGLRNGQKIISVWYLFDRNKTPTIRVKISDNMYKTIELRPVSFKNIIIPEYRKNHSARKSNPAL